MKPVGLGSSINLARGTARPSEHELRMRVDGNNRALFKRLTVEPIADNTNSVGAIYARF